MPRKPTKRRAPAIPPDPWERQTGEGDERWQAFQIYRDQANEDPGRKRSLRRVAAAVNKSLTIVGQWSSEDGWPTRAAAWDSEQDAQQRAATIKERVEAGKRHARTAQAHLQAATLPAIELLRRVQAEPELLRKLPFEDLIKVQAVMARVIPRLVVTERLALGLSTEQVDIRDDRARLEEEFRHMSDEALEAYLLHGSRDATGGLRVIEGGSSVDPPERVQGEVVDGG